MKSWSEITHYAGPDGMAISGTDLYVSNFSAGTVTAYSATTGLAIAGFTTISWISEPQGLATSGTDLCASTLGNNAVVEYNAITGGTIAGYTSPSGLSDPYGIAGSPVPEPGTWTMLGLSCGVLLLLRRRTMKPATSMRLSPSPLPRR